MKTQYLLKRTALLSLLSTSVLHISSQTLIEASIDTASILVGEQVQVKLKCSTNAQSHVIFPSYNQSQVIIPGVEVVHSTGIDTLLTNGGRRMELTRRYVITSFDSALYPLPPFEVTVNGRKYYSKGTIGLKVNSIPVDTIHVDQMRSPYGVVAQPFKWDWTLTVLMLLAWLCSTIAATLWIRYTDPKKITRKVVVRPPVPAHIVAMERINTLKETSCDNLKYYYMGLTDILRKYIQDRFGINAKEMTTTDIINELTCNQQDLSLSELKEVLQTADLVKFAQLAPTISDRNHDLMQALDYVRATMTAYTFASKPKVEYISLTDRKQSRIRTYLLFSATLASMVSMLLLLLSYCH